MFDASRMIAMLSSLFRGYGGVLGMHLGGSDCEARTIEDQGDAEGNTQ